MQGNRLFNTKFAAFIVCGALASLVNVVSRYILFFFLPYALSITIAFFAGMTTGFFLFKFFVFDSGRSKRILRETCWYVAVNLFALLQTLVISIALAEYFFPWAGMNFYPHDVAHVAGVGFPIITSFFGHKYLTFKKEE